MEILKSDWKLFREKIASWQEAYMEKLLKEYSQLLNDELPASSKFWALEKRLKMDKKKPGVVITLQKQEVVFDIVTLLNDGAITPDDLLDFSDELRDKVKFLQESIEL